MSSFQSHCKLTIIGQYWLLNLWLCPKTKIILHLEAVYGSRKATSHVPMQCLHHILSTNMSSSGWILKATSFTNNPQILCGSAVGENNENGACIYLLINVPFFQLTANFLLGNKHWNHSIFAWKSISSFEFVLRLLDIMVPWKPVFFLKFLNIKHFMQIIILVGMQYNYIF